VTENIESAIAAQLKAEGCVIVAVSALNPQSDLAHHYASARFSEVWTKLRAWQLTDYQRLVFLDADMLVLQNMDELFDIELPVNGIAACHACRCNPNNIATYPQSWVLNSLLFFTLAEHLYFAVERCKNGSNFANKLSWEVKRYYQREYELGVLAKNSVSQRFNVELPEDEAVNIAFHLINASGDSENSDAHLQVQLVNRIAEIVRYKLNKNIDINSINYIRFITHLRYFAERIISKKIAAKNSDDFYHELLKFYPAAMNVSWAIRDYIAEKYQTILPKDELTWLTIHISRLADSNEAEENAG